MVNMFWNDKKKPMTAAFDKFKKLGLIDTDSSGKLFIVKMSTKAAKVRKVPALKRVTKPKDIEKVRKDLEKVIERGRKKFGDPFAEDLANGAKLAKKLKHPESLVPEALELSEEALQLHKLIPLEEVKPFVDVGWKVAKTTDEAVTQLSSRYGIKVTGDAAELTHLNAIGGAVDDVYTRFPKLQRMEGSGFREINIQMKGSIKVTALEGWNPTTNASAIYHPLDKRMTVAARSKIAVEPRLKLGKGQWTISGKSMQATTRHEWGHHVYGWHADDMLSSRFDDLFNGYGSKWFRENISDYAGTNSMEAYAECFAAYTSPTYGARGARLPHEIEALFDEALKVSKGGF
jgi:hypothetical protein